MRKPGLDEFHKLLELAFVYAGEMGQDISDLNIEAFKQMLFEIHSARENMYCYVTEDGDKFTGIIIGFIGTAWFSTVNMGIIGTIYVRPGYRGGRSALKLMRGFEKWAKDHHVSNIHFEASTGITPERTYSFVGRLGYTEIGRTFQKEI